MKIRNRWLRSQWKRFRIWRCQRAWDSLTKDAKEVLTFWGSDPKTKIERGDFDN